MNSLAKKSLLLLCLALLGCCSQAQPAKDHSPREQRQLKAMSAAEADVKMMAANTANITPIAATMQMQMPMVSTGLGGGLPMNQMALGGAANMQMARYPTYPGYFPGLLFGGASGGGAPGAPFLGVSGLQTNIANNYPSYTDANVPLGLAGFGGYPGNPQAANFMYGNPMFSNPQLGNGFGAPPNLDNFAALNNIINMANAQGLGGGIMSPNPGLYPQAAAGALGSLPAGFFGGPNGISADAGGAVMERMNMRNYAPAF